MKITNEQIRQIIKEELEHVLNEEFISDAEAAGKEAFGDKYIKRNDPRIRTNRFVKREFERQQSILDHAKIGVKHERGRTKDKRTKDKVKQLAVDYAKSRFEKDYGMSIKDVEDLIKKQRGLKTGVPGFTSKDLYTLEEIATAFIKLGMKEDLTIKDFEEEPELYGKTIGFKVFKAALPAVTDNRSFMKKAGNFFKGRGFKQ